ncbi:MAG: aspartate-semialdehyde dehydrogenase [Bacteroidales bacterium]|nr:aspartate-semialdehyde dehydrogenase [Bacteroidales bacterium]
MNSLDKTSNARVIAGRVTASEHTVKIAVPVLVAGATGLVGRTIVRLLEERNFPVKQLIPAASERSAGNIVLFRGCEIPVVPLEQALKTEPGIALFSAGSAVSKIWASRFAEAGWKVVDNSSCWRMDRRVPLVVPEINGHLLQPFHCLVANPNCSTIQMVMALAPLHKAFTLQRIVAATYQSVSGSGRKGLDQLEYERQQWMAEGATPQGCNKATGSSNKATGNSSVAKNIDSVYPYPIYGNAIPLIGDILSDGYSEEEKKMALETRKIFNTSTIGVSATTVRVPVRGAHCVSINAQFARPFTMDKVHQLLHTFPGLSLTKNSEKQAEVATPLEAEGTDLVYVGRVRRDVSVPNGLELWTVADNLRKGAALNAVQIAERLYT